MLLVRKDMMLSVLMVLMVISHDANGNIAYMLMVLRKNMMLMVVSHQIAPVVVFKSGIFKLDLSVAIFRKSVWSISLISSGYAHMLHMPNML